MFVDFLKKIKRDNSRVAVESSPEDRRKQEDPETLWLWLGVGEE